MTRKVTDAIVAVLAVIAICCGLWTIGRHINYRLMYEDMVRDTVRGMVKSMVKQEALR